jgi:hypothetical protein
MPTPEPIITETKSTPSQTPKVVLVAILILAAIVIGALVTKTKTEDTTQTAPVAEKKPDRTVRTSVNVSSAQKLPVGFPEDIPIEVMGITESHRRDYVDRGMAVYFAAFLSSQTLSQKKSEYESFMKSSGYVIKEQTQPKDRVILFATKGEDDLSVMVSPEGSKSIVKITYVDR